MDPPLPGATATEWIASQAIAGTGRFSFAPTLHRPWELHHQDVQPFGVLTGEIVEADPESLVDGFGWH